MKESMLVLESRGKRRVGKRARRTDPDDGADDGEEPE